MKTGLRMVLLGFLLLNACAQRRVPLKAAPVEARQEAEGTFYFDFGKSVLGNDQKDAIVRKTYFLKNHRELTVVLEGHTDPIGSSEYNLQLGDRRARAVKSEMVRQGVEAGRIVVMSYGETRLLAALGRAWRARDPESAQERRVVLRVR